MIAPGLHRQRMVMTRRLVALAALFAAFSSLHCVPVYYGRYHGYHHRFDSGRYPPPRWR
jgi:hypothetical protein